MPDLIAHSIPTREQLREIAGGRDGAIAEIPFPILLLALAVEKKDAVLHLRRTPLEKSIAFDEGAPVDCRSNVATETLGRFMMSTGKLSQADFQTSLSASAARGVPLDEILIERRLVDPTDIYKILQQNLARKLLDVFTWRSGDFQISWDVPRIESPLRVKVPQLILTGIVKYGNQSDINAAISTLGKKSLTIQAEPFFPSEEIRLNKEQTLLRDALQSPHGIDELPELTKLAPEEVNRHLYGMMLLGVITEAGEEAAKPRPRFELSLDVPFAKGPATSPAAQVDSRLSMATAAPSLPTPAPSPVVERPDAGNRDELMRHFLSHRRKDAFDLLGLPEEATISMIVRTYLGFAERMTPSRFRPDPPESLREKADEVFLAGARAYAELADNERRKALVERRNRRLPSKGEQTDPLSVRSGLVDPEMLFRKGKEFSDAGRDRDALPYFEKAADIDAQNEVYTAELTFCRFHLLISTATQALTALKETIRTNSNCGIAWFYAGKIHATIGNRDEAEAYLRRAASLMKGDPRPLQELRAFPKKFQ